MESIPALQRKERCWEVMMIWSRRTETAETVLLRHRFGEEVHLDILLTQAAHRAA